jgi:L-rhamnose mutarotase
MERYCFKMVVLPGREGEYERRHDEIWPELVAEIEAAGVRNYTLFRRGLEVIAYCECHPDAATAFGKLAQSEVNARWSEYFGDVLDQFVDADGNLLEASEVWHLD